MKKCFYSLPLLLVLVIVAPGLQAGEIDINDTKLLSQPAVSKMHIAFAYAGDETICPDTVPAICGDRRNQNCSNPDR